MLLQRILSSLVMVPVALGAVWWGGIGFSLLVGAAAAAIVWEWTRMVTTRFSSIDAAVAVLVGGAAVLAVLWPIVSWGLVGAAAVLAVLRDGRPTRGLAWSLGGILYAAIPAVLLVFLRQAPDGLLVVAWLLALVWATDVGAYACGRLIGGPLLLPRISPKKTWAGLLGGAALAGLVSVCFSWCCSTVGSLLTTILTGICLAFVAQAGDLFESWVKRRWGIKDSSQLIPGHGGVMDRVDGVLAVVVAWTLATLMWG